MADIFDEVKKGSDIFDDIDPEPKKTAKGNIALPGWLQKMSEEQSKPGFERDVLPILGDVAGSFMPSPFGKAKAVTRLGKIGLKGANLLFKSGTAAGGSAAGEFGAQKVFGEETDFSKMGKQALWGATGEGGARIAGRMLKPVFKWASNFTVLGSMLKESVRKKMIDKTTKRASDFIEEFAPEVVRSQGKIADIGELSVRVSEAIDEKNVAYELFNKHIDTLAKGKEGGVILDDTQQLMGGLRDRAGEDTISYIEKIYGYKPGSKQALFLKGVIDEELIDADNLKDFLASIYKKGKKSDWGDILPTQRKARETLKETIKTDISKASPEAKTAKEYADKVFGEIANFKKIQKIFNKNLRQAPSGDLFLNPTGLANTIEKNKKIISDIDPKLWKRMQEEANFYRKMAKNWRPPTSKNNMAFGVMGGLAAMGLTTAMSVTKAISPNWIPVSEGFGVFSALMQLSPKSRRALGEIVKASVVKPAMHIGGPMMFPPFQGPQ